MNELLQKATAVFRDKVNLLLVDDDRHILKSLESNFSSPLFSIRSVDSFNDALALARGSAPAWHCWVLDIDLGEGRTGIDIVKTRPDFPFVLVLSGLQSMRIAADAMRQGALAVFDKDPDSLERIYDETCKVAALGYLLGGKHTQYLPVYRLLCSEVIPTPEAWAEKACISLRQLHRICDVHPVTSPKTSLAFFYTLYLLLWRGKKLESPALPPLIGEEHRERVEAWMAHLEGKR